VVDVPVKDNQLVKKGDLLMQIDPEHYQLAVNQAKALVASRKATWEMRKVNAKRRADLDNLVISRKTATTPATSPTRPWPTTSRPRRNWKRPN
jgi:multidrug resistance efflux pump